MKLWKIMNNLQDFAHNFSKYICIPKTFGMILLNRISKRRNILFIFKQTRHNLTAFKKKVISAQNQFSNSFSTAFISMSKILKVRNTTKHKRISYL